MNIDLIEATREFVQQIGMGIDSLSKEYRLPQNIILHVVIDCLIVIYERMTGREYERL